MLHWLIEPALDLTDPAPWFLSAREAATYTSFRFEKRRAEWLLGRWTAKRLVQAFLVHTGAPLVPLESLSVLNDPDSVPYVELEPGAPLLAPAHAPALALPILSLSHSHGHALAAVAGAAEVHALGCDLERVDPRTQTFVRDYFTPGEVARVDATPVEERDRMVTALWCAKEAVLKALRKGLSVDTRAVECLLEPPAGDVAHWTAFPIRTDPSSLPPLGAAPLHGWWKSWGEFALALVADTPAPPPPAADSLEAELVAQAQGSLHPLAHHRLGHAGHHPSHAGAGRHDDECQALHVD